jgi:hypothetical protein
MTIDERLERLTGIVETLAGAVAAHDSVLEAHDRQIGAMLELESLQLSNFGPTEL